MIQQQNSQQHEKYIWSALFLILAIVIVKTAWVGEDSYIAFRVVDNFVNGYGLRWNIAERVQVFTNPLWVLLISCFYAITNEIFLTVSVVSIAISLLASYWLGRKLTDNILTGSLAIVALASSRAFVDYATSGLENPLSYLLAVLFFWIFFTKELNSKNLGYLILLASLSAVNRQDLILLFIPCLAYVVYFLWKNGTAKREIFIQGIIFSSPLIAWLLFSLIYYGTPFPNTYYAKLHTGIESYELFIQGIRYFLNNLNYDTVTQLIIIFSVVLAILSRDLKKIVVALGLLLYSVYIIKIGGDFMSGRFFSVPFLIAVIILVQFEIKNETKYVLGALILLVAFSVKHPTFLNDEDYETEPTIDFSGKSPNSIIDHMGIADERGAFFQESGLTVRFLRNSIGPSDQWVKLGRLEKKKGTKVTVWSNVGYYGFYAGPGLHIIDPYGLGDAFLSKLPVPKENLEHWRIGHFMRNIPSGYIESVSKNQNYLSNGYLKNYYDVIIKLTKNELFSFDRIITILKFNTGFYEDLLVGYRSLPEVSSTKSDFKAFLASKPYEGINANSYQKEFDKYYEMFQETGKFRWLGYEWHRDHILPLWKKYKKDRNLLDVEKFGSVDDFKKFLATNPHPAINAQSYESGEDTLMWKLFQEEIGDSWQGNEWHRKYILPLWKLYKKDNRISDRIRTANKYDFKQFVSKKPHPSIDSSSYDFGTSEFYFDLFQNKGKKSWEGHEWHRDSIQYLWEDYKDENNLQ